MKKAFLKTFLGVLVVATSFGSYIFLQSAKAALPDEISASIEKSSEDVQIFLPDVELISRIADKVREHLPAQ